MRVNPGKILKWLYPDVVWEIDDPEGIYLTFDDGPTPGVTEWILQTLDRYDAKLPSSCWVRMWSYTPTSNR